MRRFGCAVAVCALLSLVAATAGGAAERVLYIVNASTTVSDAEVLNALPAFQAALDQDFSPEWNTDATLQLVTPDQVPAGAWTLTIDDYSDVMGAAGYHWVKGHVPYGKAFAQEGMPWQLVFTHELFEMLADPFCDLAAGPGIRNHRSGTVYALEVGDPVQDPSSAYSRLGADGQPVTISDFVLQRWFDGQGGGWFDFTGHANHAGRVAPGGYVVKWTGSPVVGLFRVRAEGRLQ